MKPKDIFNLAVRILGLVFLYHGLQSTPILAGSLWQGFLTIFGAEPPHFGGLLSLMILVAWQLVLALWLISGAPWLMRRAYPADPATEPDPAKDRRPLLRDPAGASSP